MAFKLIALCSLMIVASAQHQNNYGYHQHQQNYQPLLNFPHEDHQHVIQMPMQNYMQQSYQSYPQQSNQMHAQQSNQMHSHQPQMNYHQQPHISYQNQQQFSYQQQPQQQNYHQQQPLKNYIHKPQQQMIQKPYVHEAEQLPQPAALSSEPIHHHQQQQQQQQQQEQQEQYETQYPEQNKQEQYQIVEKAPENEIVQKAEKAETSKTSVEYDYNYAVHDENTNDIKQHHEKALNGAIVGQYSLMDADGYRRIVDYTADDKNGFKAVVRREFVEVPKNAAIAEKVPVVQKINPPTQYFSSPAPSKSPITEVSKPTPVPQQTYKQLISAPIVQQQQYQFSAPASTKHINPTQHDLQYFSPPTPSVPVAQNSLIHQHKEHQQQAPHQQQQFFYHPAPVLEKYLTPANQQQQYYSAPTSAPTKVNTPVTEYSSFENHHPYTEVNFVGPNSNYHF